MYDPATISAADLDAIIGRLNRYLSRHGSRYGETPIRPDRVDDVRQSILADWFGDDWTAREWTALERNGKSLFPATLSTLGQHLRAMLFHAGRCRRRQWRETGTGERVADGSRQSRNPDGFRGTGSASVAADPARIVAAAESASGQLVLSPAAERERVRRNLPTRYRGGLSYVPDDSPSRFRWMRRRSRVGYTVDVVARREDRTEIEIRPYRVHRFERVGMVPNRVEANAHYRPALGIGRIVRSRPNPALALSRRPLPQGFGYGECREAIG
jgi:hypothetical protein